MWRDAASRLFDSGTGGMRLFWKEVPPRARLLFLSDGLTEVFDREDRDFGLERIKDVVRAHARDPLAAICDATIRAVRAHGVQTDDQTIMLVRVLAPAGETRKGGLAS